MFDDLRNAFREAVQNFKDELDRDSVPENVDRLLAGMIGGFLTTVVWVVVFKERFYDLYEMIPGFAAGFACCIGVSLLGEPDPEAVAELDDVRRTVGPVFRSR